MSGGLRSVMPGVTGHLLRFGPPTVSCVPFGNLYPAGPSLYMCPRVDTPPDTRTTPYPPCNRIFERGAKLLIASEKHKNA